MGHHDHGEHGDERRLRTAVWLTGGFMLVEAAGGVLAGSLTLLADAGHMLTDTAALGLAWFALRVAQRPPDARRSYGYHRFPVLAAFVNGLTLFAVVGWIGFEAVERLAAPRPVLAVPMLAVAVIGLLVNVAAFRVLHGGSRDNLNLRGALLHVAGDLLGSAAAIVAAVVILWTGWTPIDPLLSIAVAALILRSSIALVRQSGHVLMQGAPEDLAAAEIRDVLMAEVTGVADVHHVHVWQLAPGRPITTLHVRMRAGADARGVLDRVHACLRERFSISHATVQVEPPG